MQFNQDPWKSTVQTTAEQSEPELAERSDPVGAENPPPPEADVELQPSTSVVTPIPKRPPLEEISMKRLVKRLCPLKNPWII